MSSQVSLNSIGSQIVSNNTNTSNYILNTSNFLQQDINTKQAIITGGASSITTNNLTTGMVLVSDGSGKVSTHGTVTSNQLTFLDGVTSSIQTQLNNKETSFDVLGISKGGIGTSTIPANTLLGATTTNTISTISLGTSLSISGSTLNVSYKNTGSISLANNYMDLNMTNNSNTTIRETFNNTIVKYNNNYKITNNSNYIIKNILNFNNNYTLQQSDYIHNISLNNIVKVVCSTQHTVFLENTGRVLSCGRCTTLTTAGTRTTQATVFVSEYVFGILGIGTQMTGIVNIVCSANHTVFLENTGKVLACGSNNFGDNRVGFTGTTTSGAASTIYIPQYVLRTNGLGTQMTGIVNIVCGNAHTVFLENTGKVLACGNNNNASITTGTRTTNSGIEYVPQYVFGIGGLGTQMTGIVNMVCSNNHTVFLENTGKVLACGANNGVSSGLGITGTRTTNSVVYVSQYVLAPGGSNQMTGIVNIACSSYNTEFLENTGKVLACGFNSSNLGITGTRTTASSTIYVPEYVLAPGGSNEISGIINIACSANHTVFLENSGKVLSCGNNNSSINLVGTGITGTLSTNTIGVYVPNYVLGTSGGTSQMTGIIKIACTDYHTVYLENTGRVLACGYNNTASSTFGITGTLTTLGIVYVPQYVLGIGGLGTQMTGIVNIVCSTLHTVFLENTGRALACGANSAGTGGITGTQNVSGTVYVPQYIIYTRNIVKNNLNIDTTYYNNIQKIACSINNTVYLENTGKVLACGYDLTGTRTTSDKVYIFEYVLGTGGIGTQMTGIINIVCSAYHTVYLENTGKVLACGYNTDGYGITGTNTTSDLVYVPQYVLGTSGSGQMTGIVNIVCSFAHTVFLENTGKVLSCGNNNAITGTRTTFGIVYVPQYVLGTGGIGTQITGIVSIACSDLHTVYLENTGKTLACGNNNIYNSRGITGTRSTNGIVYVPEYVLGTGGLTTQMSEIVSIVCSGYHTVFLENTGKVLANGVNSTSSGITGTRATNGTVYVPEYVLKTIDGITTQMTGIISIVCSRYHTVFLENTGKVLACGYNNTNYGRGITGTTTSNTGVVYVPQYVLGTNGTGTQMTGIINIVCSQYNTVFLENTGKTLACGYNTDGNGITGTLNTSGVVYVPQYVIYTQNLFKNYIKNAINGNNCIFAITDTNTVIANYDNTYGDLGTIYPGYNYNNFVTNYTGSGNLSGVAKIACGLYHTIFLLYTNTSYSCGFNNYGQLGTNNTITYTIPTAITGGTFITNIACGLYHTVLLSGTTAKSCGLNNYGQLGLGDNNNRSQITDIVLANVSDIDCGEYFTVLEVGTTVYSTGLNDKGQLGVGDITNRIIPTQVLAINNVGGTIANVKLIKCTKNNIIFLFINNTIAVCGNNVNNIYNDNNIQYYNYPSLIKIISETKTNILAIYTNIYTDEIYIKTF